MPPPSLPFYSELEPPHERAPVPPVMPVMPANRQAVPVGVEAAEEEASLNDGHESAPSMSTDEAAERFDAMSVSGTHDQSAEAVAVTADIGATAEEMVERSPIPERVATYTAPRRRTPVHGVARIAQGDVPMARSSDGRPLPRAYASHRRPSYLGLRVADVAELADVSSEGSPPDAAPVGALDEISEHTPSPSAPIEIPTNVLVVDDREVTVASTPAIAETRSPAAADAPAMDSARTLSRSADATVDASPVAVDTPSPRASESRHIDVPRPPEGERSVEVPLERLSDRGSGATRRHARVTATHRETDTPAQSAPRQSWTIFLIAIALVALLSSAVGVAVGAWYMKHRPAPTARP